MNNEELQFASQQNPMDKVIYLAGGCFWGVQKLFQSIPGVKSVLSGYANGHEDIIPNYNLVMKGDTGYRETVKVLYNPAQITLEGLVFAFLQVIDVGAVNYQGPDFGSQYQSGVYYESEEDLKKIERVFETVKSRSKRFAVELKPLTGFYDAEDYHQDYLNKNPRGYCHIPLSAIKNATTWLIDPGLYSRPDEETLKENLTPLQYGVTQKNQTEAPHQNLYNNHFESGIYLDIVTGEPLFSSRDKFACGCGWPSFSRPIHPDVVVFLPDNSHFMVRTEVRSRSGNSHLGHIFTNDPHSPTGDRYCINSAALRFIGREEMEDLGYGYLIDFV